MAEFVVATAVIYPVIIGLLILLTKLEASLLQPHRNQRPSKQRPSRRRLQNLGSDLGQPGLPDQT